MNSLFKLGKNKFSLFPASVIVLVRFQGMQVGRMMVW